MGTNKKIISRQENSLRDELKNEVERNKEIEKEIKEAYQELRGLDAVIESN